MLQGEMSLREKCRTIAASRHGPGRVIAKYPQVTGNTGQVSLKIPRVGSGHCSAKNFLRVGRSDGSRVENFIQFLCKINIDPTKNRHFIPEISDFLKILP